MIVDPLVFFNINNCSSIITRNADVYSIDEFNSINVSYSVFEHYQTSTKTFLDIVSNTFLKDFKKPFMIIADSFGIPQFTRLKFNNDVVEQLNKDGLHIFINEPLVKYTGDRCSLDRTNLSADTLKNFNFSNIRFEMTEYARKTLKSFQLDSINDLVLLNHLNNVSVYTPDYNAQEFFKESYPLITLYCQDLFLSESVAPISNLPDIHPTPIQYKFLCSNWRYAPHRHLVMSYLINFSGKYSWYYNGSFDQLNNNLWFDLEQWDHNLLDQIKTGLDKLNNSTPLNLDLTVDQSTNIKGNLGDWLLLPTYKDKPFCSNSSLFDNIFCSIINECDFPDPTSNISEKTLMPIKYKKPFVLVGQPGSLDYAKKLGFKTFESFWDESYDNETNHEQRFIKIFKTIEYINSFSIEKLEDLYFQMTPILEHNYENLKQLASSKSWPRF